MDRRTLTRFKRAYGSASDPDLADQFKISLTEVRRLGAEHSLGKNVKVFPCAAEKGIARWSAKEEEQLRELYPATSNEEIGTILGRTVQSVMSKAHRLKLQKTAEHITETGRENIAVRWEENSP